MPLDETVAYQLVDNLNALYKLRRELAGWRVEKCMKVRSAEHIDLPPFEDENGDLLVDSSQSDFFRVWSDGVRARWIAWTAVNIIETSAPAEI
jgi:hypothetical protein